MNNALSLMYLLASLCLAGQSFAQGSHGETLTVAPYTAKTSSGSHTTNLVVTTSWASEQVSLDVDYSISCGHECSPLAPGISIWRDDHVGQSQSGGPEKTNKEGHLHTSMPLTAGTYTFSTETLEAVIEFDNSLKIIDVDIRERRGAKQNLTDTIKWEILPR